MITTIIFDFDGVIIDSFDICYQSFCLSFKGVTKEEYKALFNQNIFEAFERIKEKKRKPEIDIKIAIEYARKERLKIGPVQGMVKVLEQLSQKYNLYINTSSVNHSVEQWLEKYKLGQYIEKVLGADIAKSKTDKFQKLIDQGISKENMVFITDTAGDIYEASKLHIPSIADTRGFHDAETLLTAEPRFIATKPEEILTYVDNLQTTPLS